MIFRKVKIEKVKTSRFLKHGLQISCWCFNLFDFKIVKDEMHKIILINVYPRYLKKKGISWYAWMCPISSYSINQRYFYFRIPKLNMCPVTWCEDFTWCYSMMRLCLYAWPQSLEASTSTQGNSTSRTYLMTQEMNLFSWRRRKRRG